MKIAPHIGSILLAACLAWGCNDQFLDVTDPNSVSNLDYWQTYDDFNYALNAAYKVLQYSSVCGGFNSIYDRNRTDLCRSFDFYAEHWSFTTFSWSGTEMYIGQRWNELYVGVFRTNQILDQLRTAVPSSTFTQEQMNQIQAQSRFLRALYYFWVCNSYGGAVIHTTVPITNEEQQGHFFSAQEVLDSVIIPDLQYAIDYLPVSWPDTELGRATRGAAKGILGKVYLYHGFFDAAIVLFSDLLASNQYFLTNDISSNFSLAGEHNTESIFEVNFSEVLAPGIDAGTLETTSEDGQIGHASSTATLIAPDTRGGLRILVPSFWMTELYLKDSIDVDAPINATRRWSSRANASIAFIGQDGEYYLQATEDAAPWYLGGAECAYWKKGTNWATKENEEAWTSTSRSGINQRILRLADVKLMYAEALLRRPGSTNADFNEALTQVDDIRNRSAVITLRNYANSNGGQIPLLHLRGTKPFASPWAPLTPACLLTHIMRVERPLELAFEGNSIRWHDLRRWDMIAEVLNQIETIDYTKNWMIQWYNYVTLSRVYPEEDDFLSGAISRYQGMQAANYHPDRNNYFPIPINELNSNTNLRK